MITFLKNLFHKHTHIYTSRTLIARGKHYSNAGGFVDVDNTNIYLLEGYCLTCEKKFTAKQEILEIFDQPQPYDKELT